MTNASKPAACGSFSALARLLGLALVTASSALGGQEAFKLLPGDGAAKDFFGASVAISGTTAIVGAVEDDDNGLDSGSVYLFDVATGLMTSKLLANDGGSEDRFGISVAISGNTAIVGASYDDDNGVDSGSAYLFDVTTGQQIAKLLPNDGATNDDFGRSVAISGGTAIVGAYRDGDNGLNSGSAYLFDVATGQQIAKLMPGDGTTADLFGYSVAISGNTAIVSALGDDDNGADSGSVYLFDRTTGQQVAKLLPSDGALGDGFGISVAANGTTIIVGAYHDDDNGPSSGSAYLFDLSNGQQIVKLLPSDGEAWDYFGRSVAISDTAAIVGVYGDDQNGFFSGSAYLFALSTAGPQITRLVPSDGAANDLFGYSVAISGSTALVGANLNSDNGPDSGSAYLFGPLPPTWILSPVSGHWYQTTDPQSWMAAEAQAESWGGHLAAVRSQAENDWLQSTFASTDSLWIGYTDQATEATFEWISGEPAGYENWAQGEPDDGAGADWALLQAGTGLWTDETQLPEHAGLVEVISDDCNMDSSPDAYQIAQEPWLDWTGDGVLNDCVSPSYCTAALNSTGQAGVIELNGTPVITQNEFTLRADHLPPNRIGYFLMSESTGFVPAFGGSDGNLCLGASIIRLKGAGLTVNTGNLGMVSKDIDLTALPQHTLLLPGDTWYFQLWFRDEMTSNTTDGIEVMFR
ncbi:MAG: hypothetical protein ACI8QC_001670 [Planctomycetota bacterium]|jgi:hypothetical protein